MIVVFSIISGPHPLCGPLRILSGRGAEGREHVLAPLRSAAEMPSAPLPDSNAPKGNQSRQNQNYHLITNTKQPNKMEKKNIYETPEAILVDFQAEGVLCQSKQYTEEWGGGGVI